MSHEEAELERERAEYLLDNAAQWVEQALTVFKPRDAAAGREVLAGLQKLKNAPSSVDVHAFEIVGRYRERGLEGLALRRAVERHVRLLEPSDPAVAAALAECSLAPRMEAP